MPNPVEGLFEVYEDMLEVTPLVSWCFELLLVLEVFLTENA